jgi:2-hydroxychromene-2-carboxylate isomerase
MALAVPYFIDFKSPYAYLSLAPTRQLERDFDIALDWRPLTLHIPNYLDAVDERSAHNWRKVKYAYMDARRLANRVGLTVLGPKKIFDSSIASIALLYAKDKPGFDRFVDIVFEGFFKRTLDIEQVDQIVKALGDAGIDAAGFPAYLAGPGREFHDKQRVETEQSGVFGVPTLIVEGEIFWGGDRIDLVRERLTQMGLKK